MKLEPKKREGIMPRICYEGKEFRSDTRALIDQANEIISEYMAEDLRLTLRQLYYQFVARDLFPESYRDAAGTKNNLRSYKKLVSWVNDGRLAGLIDWSAIEDRTRNLVSVNHWDSPAEIIRTAADQYRIDKWADQEFRPEVWIEKEALAGVIEPVCRRLDVSFLACRGYMSQSEMWVSGQRMLRNVRRHNQEPVIIHLGDHDPSGIDMTRDIQDRIRTFKGELVEVRRVALNRDQVDEYDPPPNPAKTTDSRFQGYIVRYGEESWELDALEPNVLVSLIEKEVARWRNEGNWATQVARESEQRERLQEIAGSQEWT